MNARPRGIEQAVGRPRSRLLVLLAGATLGACTDTPTAPPPVPSVTISTATSTLVFAQGDDGSLDVAITRNGGFTGAVVLDVSGVPAGVAVEIADNPVAGNSARLRFGVAGAAAPGTYPLTLTAAGAGIAAQTLPLELRVVARAPQPVTVDYCPATAPAWVAFADGDGAWRQVEPTAAGGRITFSAEFSTDRGAVAVVFRLRELTAVVVWYGTPAELPLIGDTNPLDCASAVSKTLRGTVAGLDAGEFAIVGAGGAARVQVFPEQQGGFVLNAVPGGPQDLLAARFTPVDGAPAITGMILRRGVDAPDGSTLPVFDFAGPEAFPPAVANVVVTGLGPEGTSGGTQLLTSNNQIAVDGLANQETDATRRYVALPEAQLLPGDLQVLSVTANPTGDGAGRLASLYFHTPADRTLALGAPLIPPTFTTVATAPALRVRARFAPQSDYERAAGVQFQEGGATIVSINMTAAYARLAGGGYDIVVPDLSQAAGFDPAWALRPGETLLWEAGRIGGTLGLGADAVPSDGATRRSASAAGVIAAP